MWPHAVQVNVAAVRFAQSRLKNVSGGVQLRPALDKPIVRTMSATDGLTSDGKPISRWRLPHRLESMFHGCEESAHVTSRSSATPAAYFSDWM
jgi:hypothetical protein